MRGYPPIFFLDFNNTWEDLPFLHNNKLGQNTFELVGTLNLFLCGVLVAVNSLFPACIWRMSYLL